MMNLTKAMFNKKTFLFNKKRLRLSKKSEKSGLFRQSEESIYTLFLYFLPYILAQNREEQE